jgi:drug/metabolite transporter (DMT)-like permease
MAVLLAAAFHAGWNAIVKVNLDRYLSVTLIALAAGVVAAAALPFVAVPGPAAWPFLLVSGVLHTGYNLFLSRAYRAGDLGQVYPIARGSAPLLVALITAFAFGEVLPPPAMLGVGLLVAGVWLMSVRGGAGLARLEGHAVGYALATSVFIAGYTLTDGFGARANGDASSYAVWLFVLDGLSMLGVLLARRGVDGLRALRGYWIPGAAGGAMSLGAYWIVIWAMTVAPIALVAALRESSVLFAAALSVLVLREPLTRWRTLAALTIVAGILITRLGQ